jgi:hypothetical protein
MKRVAQFLLLSIFLLLLAGCAFNSVKPLTFGAPISEGHTVIIYGVGVEEKWAYPRFGVHLEEYSVKSQSSTGNCFRFNRAEASVASTAVGTQYFAFEVPPGHYVYSAFNGAPLRLDTQAFTAPEGRIVYIGDFIYSEEKTVLFRRNFDALATAMGPSLPNLNAKVSIAEMVPAQRPRFFLCAP